MTTSNTPSIPNGDAHSRDAKASSHPTDWPGPGPIDLNIHDLPHQTANTEWWYANGHFTAHVPGDEDKPGRNFSFFVAFFKLWLDEESYVINWGLLDADKGKYYTHSAATSQLPKWIAEKFRADETAMKDGFGKGLLKVLEKGTVPLPDRLFDKPAFIASGDQLHLDFGGNTLTKDHQDGTYMIHLEHPDGIALTLKMTPQKQPIRHGDDGIVSVKEHREDDMFYYFIPRLAAMGEIRLPAGKSSPGAFEELITTGSAWYDHEFDRVKVHEGWEGRVVKEATQIGRGSFGWNWVALQLSNGFDITGDTIVDKRDGRVVDNRILVVSPDSVRSEYLDIELTPLNQWVSLRTAAEWPTSWRLSVPAAQIELQLDAIADDQEFITLIGGPAYWEGRVRISGVFHGEPVTGNGFIERTSFESAPTMDTYLKRLGKEVWKEVERVIPAHPSYEVARAAVCSTDDDHIMESLNTEALAQTVFDPIREYVARSGKNWRSIALLVCMDALGTNIHQHRHWLSVPEIVHVGGLIVDDVEDRSEIRRGGPTCHLVHGEPIAINAGTAAYFIGPSVALSKEPDLSIEQKFQIYEAYFIIMKAGHVGQAFDIRGLEDLMPGVVETGRATELESRIMCTHRLKTAIGPGYVARIAAIIGGGTREQSEALGGYFEALGLAFQVIDDVLDMRGHPTRPAKEDIATGKITHPLAMAMSSERLPTKEARASLWERLKSKPDPPRHRKRKEAAMEVLNRLMREKAPEDVLREVQVAIAHHAELEDKDAKTVAGFVADLEACGAIDASCEVASNIFEAAWKKLDAALPDSRAKVVMWALGKRLINTKEIG